MQNANKESRTGHQSKMLKLLQRYKESQKNSSELSNSQQDLNTSGELSSSSNNSTSRRHNSNFSEINSGYMDDHTVNGYDKHRRSLSSGSSSFRKSAESHFEKYKKSQRNYSKVAHSNTTDTDESMNNEDLSANSMGISLHRQSQLKVDVDNEPSLDAKLISSSRDFKPVDWSFQGNDTASSSDKSFDLPATKLDNQNLDDLPSPNASFLNFVANNKKYDGKTDESGNIQSLPESNKVSCFDLERAFKKNFEVNRIITDEVRSLFDSPVDEEVSDLQLIESVINKRPEDNLASVQQSSHANHNSIQQSNELDKDISFGFKTSKKGEDSAKRNGFTEDFSIKKRGNSETVTKNQELKANGYSEAPTVTGNENVNGRKSTSEFLTNSFSSKHYEKAETSGTKQNHEQNHKPHSYTEKEKQIQRLRNFSDGNVILNSENNKLNNTISNSENAKCDTKKEVQKGTLQLRLMQLNRRLTKINLNKETQSEGEKLETEQKANVSISSNTDSQTVANTKRFLCEASEITTMSSKEFKQENFSEDSLEIQKIKETDNQKQVYQNDPEENSEAVVQKNNQGLNINKSLINDSTDFSSVSSLEENEALSSESDKNLSKLENEEQYSEVSIVNSFHTADSTESKEAVQSTQPTKKPNGVNIADFESFSDDDQYEFNEEGFDFYNIEQMPIYKDIKDKLESLKNFPQNNSDIEDNSKLSVQIEEINETCSENSDDNENESQKSSCGSYNTAMTGNTSLLDSTENEYASANVSMLNSTVDSITLSPEDNAFKNLKFDDNLNFCDTTSSDNSVKSFVSKKQKSIMALHNYKNSLNVDRIELPTNSNAVLSRSLIETEPPSTEKTKKLAEEIRKLKLHLSCQSTKD